MWCLSRKLKVLYDWKLSQKPVETLNFWIWNCLFSNIKSSTNYRQKWQFKQLKVTWWTTSKALYTRAHRLRLINFPRTWGERRTPCAWKGHATHPVLFVFAQKTDKFRFAANGMRTVRRWRSAGLQSHPHICTFGSQTMNEQFTNRSWAVREPFGILVYTRLKEYCTLFRIGNSTLKYAALVSLWRASELIGIRRVITNENRNKSHMGITLIQHSLKRHSPFPPAGSLQNAAIVKPAIHYSRTWRIGAKLFFRRIKYCWQKRDERVAVHCSLFAINFRTADDFFPMKKYFVFVDEIATSMQILRTAYGEKPVCETWRTPFIHYSLYIIF